MKNKTNIWQSIQKPFTVLAPMDDVTDVVFREIVNQVSRPDIFFTEFTNVDALFSNGRDSQIRRLKFFVNQKPIIAQIWGKNPSNFTKAARLIEELGFDGIDINMGCPIKAVVKNGACSALIKDHQMAAQQIEATREGLHHIPISVKTRIGFNNPEIEEWIGFLLCQSLDAIIIHGRTVKELSNTPAHWSLIREAVALKNRMKKQTIIVGNGDVKNITEAQKKANEFGVDGVMIGRGIFHNLEAFSSKSSIKLSPKDMLDLYKRHILLYLDTFGKTKKFLPLKKFAKVYINDFVDASELRVRVTAAKTPEQMLAIIDQAIATIG